jgi:hypothetical protein
MTRKLTRFLGLPGAVTETSWVLPADLSFEEWAEFGVKLRTVEKSILWLIGDWWRFGKHKYGARMARARRWSNPMIGKVRACKRAWTPPRFAGP